MDILVTVIIFLISSVWVGGFIYANDFSVPTKNNLPSTIKRILIIFPHADDEALTSGGFLSGLTRSGKDVYWIILTRGEKGTPNGQLDKALIEVRVQEAVKAAERYAIKNLIQKEYPDGDIEAKRVELEIDLRKTVKELDPDLVITYDLAGLYGHPDHIVTSEVVTKIVKDTSGTKLWYVSYPKRILKTVSLPEHMAKDTSFKDRRVFPTHKVWTGIHGLINKIKAVYSYKSQCSSYMSSMPLAFIPLWYYISLTPFEYFHEVK